MQIGVVVVTYNRLSKLKKCLQAYEQQLYQPTFLVVIDNCSTDGSSQYLDHWSVQPAQFKKIIVHEQYNLGGAGGFAEGIATALQYSSDWIWISDDDAYPEPDCFSKIKECYSAFTTEQKEKVAALCAQVRIKSTGEISFLHRRKLEKHLFTIKEQILSEADYASPYVPIDLFSFVGTAIKTTLLHTIGLPRADYFISHDDTEYSLRTREIGLAYCVCNAVVIHDSAENDISSSSWKYYFAFRNKMNMYKQYFPRRYCISNQLRTVYMIFKFYNNRQTWKQFRDACRDYANPDFQDLNKQHLPQ